MLQTLLNMGFSTKCCCYFVVTNFVVTNCVVTSCTEYGVYVYLEVIGFNEWGGGVVPWMLHSMFVFYISHNSR